MERIYNKLVRDNIPNIIKEKGEEPITRILSDEEYKKELEKKLNEEYQEVLEASGSERVEELADMLEVIKAKNSTYFLWYYFLIYYLLLSLGIFYL